MAAKSETSFFWDKLIPAAYSIGAAVVIIGALGKIMHYSWADTMLPVGLGTEAVIFVIYALQVFLRPDTSYAWEKVYPELSSDYKGELPIKSITSSGPSLTAKMDQALSGSTLSSDVMDSLRSSFNKLSDTAGKMSDISDASLATKEYASSLKAASSQITDLNKSYSTATLALNAMAEVSQNTQEYKAQFAKVTQNLNTLNAMYEVELADTNKHLKAMNSLSGSIASAMDNMNAATVDANQFRQEMAKLSQNLNSLNSVYGSMLTAMRG